MKALRRSVNIPVFVPHLGCPHDCVFCNQRQITGVSDNMTPDRVDSIIKRAILSIDRQNCHVEIAFFGGSFTAIEKVLQMELLSTAYKYIESGKVDGIRISTRPDYIDDEILGYLKNYGVTTIELGVQSMDDGVLFASRRGHTSADVIKAAKLIKKYGFSMVLQMMPGLPGDTLEKCIDTAKKIISLSPNAVRIYPTVVLKDTELCKMHQNGEYKPLEVSDALDWCSELIALFEGAGVNILRIGLMSSNSLNPQSVMAGAYHDTLGELCYSRVFYNSAREQITKKDLKDKIEIFVPKGAVSKMTGHKRENIIKLESEFLLKNIKITETDELIKSNILVEQS